ncbi:uncharacterized protein RDI95_014994 [Morus bassanus]
MARDERRTLLALQQELTEEQFQTLKYLLADKVPAGLLRPATRPDVGDILLQRFPGRALRVAADALREIPRLDLIQRYRLPGAEEEEEEEEEEETPGERGAAGGSSAPSACGAAAGPASQPAASSLPLPAASSRPSARPRRLTESDLMKVARGLGKEWQEVGIACLGLERSRLDQIREDNPGNVVLQIFQMLLDWQRREKQEATASRLCARLAAASLNPNLLDLLQSLQED